MSIPMVDLTAQYQALKSEIDAGLLHTLETAQFILGPSVRAFEDEAAACLGVKHAITCANGTDALHLALIAAGIKCGDEVITTPFTFIATAEAIRYVGAKPVFVDIDPQSFNIDVNLIKAAITPKTRAIMPVHLFGQPADMAAIRALAIRHQLKIIEDCAQSFGADIEGHMTGGMGDVGAFSFFPSKNLGCFGDGGMVSTNDDELAATLRQLRNHGSKVRYYHDIIGYNSRLDEMQAVVLRAKIKHIATYNNERRRVAHRYNTGLAGLPVTTPHEDRIGTHVFHQYTLLTDHRDNIQQALQAEKIASAIYYPIPLHQQNVFKPDYPSLSLPHAESVAQHCLSLPIYPELSDVSIDQICSVIRRAIG